MNQSQKKPKRSWWHTVPGILTAVAGVISAVTGLIVVLQQNRLIDKQVNARPEAAPAAAPAPGDPRIAKARALVQDAFVISPRHIDARGHLEANRPRLCVGSDISDAEWKNLLRAFRLKEDITLWSLSLGFYEEHMTNGTCLLTLYSRELQDEADELVAILDRQGNDPPYTINAFSELFEDWEIGFE